MITATQVLAVITKLRGVYEFGPAISPNTTIVNRQLLADAYMLIEDLYADLEHKP